MSDKPTKIIIAESKHLLRKALYALLRTNPKLDVVGEAASGKDLLDLLRKKHANIVILDAQLIAMECSEVLKIMSNRFPEVKVIVLSNQADDQTRSELIALGAKSFLDKSCDEKTLFQVIEQVVSEGFFFDSSTSLALLSKLVKDRSSAFRFRETSFNEREKEIIRNICDGKTNKEMALDLKLSASTIDFYRAKIYSKTKCNNATGLLKYALKNGLVSLT